MFKLMKYELRKQLFSKIMLLCIMALLEILFLYGLFFENDYAMGLSMGLFVFVTIGTLVFVSFESILTYSNDLKTKQSYMIFLTPNSMFKVVGAKILTTITTIGLTAATFVALIALNIGMVMIKFKEVKEIVEVIQEVVLRLFNKNITGTLIILFIATFVVEIMRIVIIGMASITLSATFLNNSKVKGLVSVIFFFAINWGLSKLGDLFIPPTLIINSAIFLKTLIFESVVVAAFYLGTVWMLDKKVSV